MFKLFVGAGLTGIGQADDGQAACALPNQLSQHAGQLDAFQDSAARIDADRDAVAAESDRLAFIQKAVDRHALFFELLNHQAHSFGRDVGVGKVVLQVQLVPGENLLQGSAKTPAQRLIQGFRAAQAENHLAGGAMQLDTVYNDTAESIAELFIGRKLRPDLGDKGFQSCTSYIVKRALDTT